MPSRGDLVRLQALIGEALTAADPVAFWRERLPDLPLDADGLCIAALLVAKLRFQRLMNASRDAADWFARDAAGFTAAFRCYHAEVAPTALDPWREAQAFAAWSAER
jgi:hypothetical protein